MHGFVALCLAALFGSCLYALFRARDTDVAVRRANRMLQEARTATGAEAARLLLACCAECEKLAAANPRHVFTLQVWGAALWLRAKAASGAEADRLFAQAEAAYAAALEVKPDDTALTLDRFWVLWDRAELHPGAPGKRYLEEICEECERLLILTPGESGLLKFWGSSLCSLGTRTPWPEADLLYAAAEEKLMAALALVPNDPDVMSSLSNVLWRRSKLRAGDEARELLLRSGQWLDRALLAKPSDPLALSSQAWVLFRRTRVLPGEETNRLLSEAAARFAAAGDFADAEALKQGWGIVLWAQARCAQGEESRRLLEEARQKLADAESHKPSSAAYNLACICAQLGRPAECRQWLDKSREPGITVSREQMATDEELAAVRECAWFRELLG